jgi:hypothetical protein
MSFALVVFIRRRYDFLSRRFFFADLVARSITAALGAVNRTLAIDTGFHGVDKLEMSRYKLWLVNS